MTPFYFGAARRRLFGLYRPARGGRAASRVAVLCSSWGQEYLRAHRAMRQLARLLSGAGINSLSFDYYGAGDSNGDAEEADLTGWRADIEAAIEEAQDMSGASRVSLIGLRLGGSLAAQVAAKRAKDVEQLVLWEPVVNGAAFIGEMDLLNENLHPLARFDVERERRDMLGFPLTPDLQRELEQLDLISGPPRPPARALVVTRERSSDCEALCKALRSLGPPESIACEVVADSAAWLEDGVTGAGAIPVKTLERIVSWAA